MAKTQTGLQQLGLTRGKAALIGTLATVLVGLLYVQYGRYAGGANTEPRDTAAARPATPREVRSVTIEPTRPDAQADSDTQAALVEFDQTRWKSPQLSKVIAYDPFALPAAFPQPVNTAAALAANESDISAEEKSKQIADALAELRMQLDELKERGVHVIIGRKDEYVAMIGDRMVHVGDEINEFTVTEIDPKEGVRLEWKPPE